MSLQLEIAKDRDLPVILHTPPDVGQTQLAVSVTYEMKRFVERSVDLVHRVGLPADRVVLDHLDTEEWVKFALESGWHAGITIQEWRGVSPEQAARLSDTFGPDRGLLNTDTSSMPSDHLGVPKAVFSMRRRKIPGEKIQRVVYRNPLTFYRLPL